jgi:hypothetical protein
VDAITIDGLPLLDRHPTIVFGDGGAAKSSLALALASRAFMPRAPLWQIAEPKGFWSASRALLTRATCSEPIPICPTTLK